MSRAQDSPPAAAVIGLEPGFEAAEQVVGSERRDGRATRANFCLLLATTKPTRVIDNEAVKRPAETAVAMSLLRSVAQFGLAFALQGRDMGKLPGAKMDRQEPRNRRAPLDFVLDCRCQQARGVPPTEAKPSKVPRFLRPSFY